MRVGTRGSALALVQARHVATLLGGDQAGVEVVTVTTSGDRGALLGDKSRWVKELEAALLAGEIDLAVHSAKDVPTELPAGLTLAGVPARIDARDALCGAPSLAALRSGAVVGTSSLRRAAELRALRPDLDVVALRGNVDTRLRKLAAGDAEAIVLAVAGLERLGRADAIDGLLDELVPAPGQGALALEVRDDDATSAAAAAALSDPDSAADAGGRASACPHARRDLPHAARRPRRPHGRRRPDAAQLRRPARRLAVAARRADGERRDRPGDVRRRSRPAAAGGRRARPARRGRVARRRRAAACLHPRRSETLTAPGRVWLVGTGPGDIELMTGRALQASSPRPTSSSTTV